MPITFVIDEDSSVPPFEQVKQCVVAAINSREAKVDEKLPAIRALATELNLAVNTVARSYRELEEAGFVVTQGRSGTRIKAGAVPSEIALSQMAQEFTRKALDLGVSESQIVKAVRTALN